MNSTTGAIVVGAGPAGLASAACLKEAGVETLLLESAASLGASWRQHYDRLHLHTDRDHSGLPGLPMPRSFPRYPSRAQVVDYLSQYAEHFCLMPRLRTSATRALRENGEWRVEAKGEAYRAPALVIATGATSAPFRPRWAGDESFAGSLCHSSAYRNPRPYAGKHVLVVGCGNSGGEIALDLAEAGTSVGLSVRGPINIIPRDLLGLPILTWASLLNRLPPRLADQLTWPLMRLSIGSLRRLGLERPARGPRADLAERGRVPLIDIGTVAAIRRGRIAIRADIRAIHPDEVEFVDGRREAYDAIIAATGFRPDLRPLLPEAKDALDAGGAPKLSGAPAALPGLYFCGFRAAPAGQLRRIGVEAVQIATDVAGRSVGGGSPAVVA